MQQSSTTRELRLNLRLSAAEFQQVIRAATANSLRPGTFARLALLHAAKSVATQRRSVGR